MSAYFQTDIVHVRKPAISDAEAVFRNYAQDSDATRYLVWKPHASPGESKDWMARCVSVFDETTDLPLVIALHDTDEAVGMIEARIDRHIADVGYVLAKACWNRGIMSEVLAWFVEFLLARPSIYRVQAVHDVDNPASGRVMLKAGLTPEGLLKRYSVHPNVSSEPRDVLMYARIK